MASWRKNPLEECGGRHVNATLEFHECMCQFDYAHQRSNTKALKFKHCQLAHDMRKINNFELYVVIAAVVGVVVILGVAALCSCKWYIQTKTNPCSCCFCSCCTRKKKRKDRTPNECVQANGNVLDCGEETQRSSGRSWTAMHLDPNKEGQSEVDSPPARKCDKEDHNLCMKFCLSDPVQDCCEFFDCDLMWRKRNIYTIPIFGKRKNGGPLQRRPTRAAPPPPKPTAPPTVKNPEPVIEDYGECEPVPEAPPSPEPVRTDQPRAMYVDPLSFLQRPFLRSREKAADDDDPEPLYSKVKDFVFGMARKSASLASLNKLGLSENPNGSPSRAKAPSDTKGKKSNRSSKTGSLASLHNLSNEQLDTSYNSKRSMSLASLHMLDSAGSTQALADKKLQNNKPGSRMSLHNVDEDDVPPAKRKDEYIDLEEMSKRLAAKMALERAAAAAGMPVPVPAQTYGTETSTFHSPSASAHHIKQKEQNPSHFFRTHASAMDSISTMPDFIPASAYGQPNPGYYPAVPASGNKPAIPARTNVCLSSGSGGTLGRPKPAVPPRPTNNLGPGSASPKLTNTIGGSPRSFHTIGSASPRSIHTMGGSSSPRSIHTMGGSVSPKPRAPIHPGGTLTRPGGTLNKPVSPPPPPPVRGPIESSI